MTKINPKKIVCIFAHPDDEAFGPGGTIAKFATEAEVYLICVTNGDADKKFSHGKVSGGELGKIRREELQTSARILGVKEVHILNFKDGSLNNNNYHEVTESIKRVLNTIRPDTILTYDFDGVSGHLDHVAVSLECTYLFERLKYLKNILYFCNNKEEKKLVGKNYFIYFPEGYDRKDVDLIIDVGKYFDLKKKAMMAHKSQIKDALWLLTFLRKYLKEEFFKVATKL